MDQLALLATEFGDSSDFEVDGINENDVSDEEIEPEELARRMWKDRVRLRRIKEREQRLALQQAELEKSKPKQISDQAMRKKMARAQDGILKYMLKLMEVCNARGFVYGIIPEKGKPVSGASDNIRAWWKEKVKFDKNGPAAIAKYEAEHLVDANAQSSAVKNEHSLMDLQDATLGSLLSSLMQHFLQREERLVLGIDNGVSEITHHSAPEDRNRAMIAHSSSNEYDVDGFEEAPLSTSSKDDEQGLSPAAQSSEEHVSRSGRERANTKHVYQAVLLKEGTKKQPPKRKRARHSSVAVEQEVQRTDDAPENLIPDMNRLDQVEIPGMANQITSFNQIAVTSEALQHRGNAQGHVYLPGAGVNSFDNAQPVDATPVSIYMGDQHVRYGSSDDARSKSGNTFPLHADSGFNSFPSSYQTLPPKQSLPLPMMDHHVVPMGIRAAADNSPYGDHVIGGGNSTSVPGDMQHLVDFPFYVSGANNCGVPKNPNPFAAAAAAACSCMTWQACIPALENQVARIQSDYCDWMAPVLYHFQYEPAPSSFPSLLRNVWFRLYPHGEEPVYQVFREQLAESLYEFNAQAYLVVSSDIGSYSRRTKGGTASTPEMAIQFATVEALTDLRYH
ncbi:hypothetical protein ZWY2020_038134 [Hordeum vulgare]|nr:hypothetical protein ZWY2020_038134 [Hordeum vulgare]